MRTTPCADPAAGSPRPCRDGRARRRSPSPPPASCSRSPCAAPPRGGSRTTRDRLLALGGVDDQAISPFLIMSTMCGRPSRTLLTRSQGMPPSPPCPRSRRSRKPRSISSRLPSSTRRRLVAVAHADEGLAPARQRDAGGELRLGDRPRRRCGPRPSPRRWTSSPGRGSGRRPGTCEREHRLLHRVVGGTTLAVTPCSASVCRPCSARRSWPAAGRWPWRRTARCARRAG
jgi:hypothetical protein